MKKSLIKDKYSTINSKIEVSTFWSKLFLFLTKILFLKNIKINFQYTYWEKMHTKKCGLPNKQTFHLINVV